MRTGGTGATAKAKETGAQLAREETVAQIFTGKGRERADNLQRNTTSQSEQVLMSHHFFQSANTFYYLTCMFECSVYNATSHIRHFYQAA